MLLSKHPQGNQKEVISLRKWEKVCLGLFCAVLIAVFAWLITLDSRNSHIGNLVMKPGIYPLAKPDLSPSLANNEYLVLSYNATKKTERWLFVTLPKDIRIVQHEFKCGYPDFFYEPKRYELEAKVSYPWHKQQSVLHIWTPIQ